jgi:hypothetical protein
MARKKKPDFTEYKFKLDAYSPESIPMRHLAAYLEDLAIIFGEEGSVHFDRLEDGCVQPVIRVAHEAYPKVRNRIHLVKQHAGPPEAQEASKRINTRLRDDNTDGYIISPDNKRVLVFPGAKEIRQSEFGPFTQHDVMEGTPIKIGGEQDWVPVHLEGRDKDVVICLAKRPMAKEMAAYLFETPIRVEGNARWLRNSEGNWELIRFWVHEFKPIKDFTFKDDVNRFRAIPGEWKNREDPLSDLAMLRYDDEVQ